jgi:hypothetical protein
MACFINLTESVGLFRGLGGQRKGPGVRNKSGDVVVFFITVYRRLFPNALCRVQAQNFCREFGFLSASRNFSNRRSRIRPDLCVLNICFATGMFI